MKFIFFCTLYVYATLACTEFKIDSPIASRIIPQDIPRIYPTKEIQWLNEICSPKYMGRKAGSSECNDVAGYLSQELAAMGYEVFVQDFVFKDTYSLRNIFVISRGKSDSLFVVGAHYDGAIYGTTFQAADDNGSGVVALLSLCKALSEVTVEHEKTIVLAFWAAEEATLGSAFNGSRYFLDHFEDKSLIVCYCNLDCFANKDQGIYFYYSMGNDYACQRMSRLLRDEDNTEIEIIIKQTTKFNSDYVSFSLANIPFFGWNDYDTRGLIHSNLDRIEFISMDKVLKVVNLTLKYLLCE